MGGSSWTDSRQRQQRGRGGGARRRHNAQQQKWGGEGRRWKAAVVRRHALRPCHPIRPQCRTALHYSYPSPDMGFGVQGLRFRCTTTTTTPATPPDMRYWLSGVIHASTAVPASGTPLLNCFCSMPCGALLCTRGMRGRRRHAKSAAAGSGGRQSRSEGRHQSSRPG